MACKVICGDMLDVLDRPEYFERFDFCFCDPPFNIGHPYVGYQDSVEDNSYQWRVLHWVIRAWASLNETGVLALHGNDYLQELYLRYAHSQGMHRIATVIWHYRFGQHQDANWINSHAYCLVFAKDPKNYTWNPDEVLVESDRASTYGDGRITQSKRGGRRVPLTVWGIPSDGPNWGRVQGNSRERRAGHPNQLPEVYLERLLRAYTSPGDYVLDPFCGSGTTAAVATTLGRVCVTIDVSEESCRSARERISKGAVRVGGSDG